LIFEKLPVVKMQDRSIKAGRVDNSALVTGQVKGHVTAGLGNSVNGSQNFAEQSLAEAATKIQQLLQQLEQSYPTTTTVEQMQVATRAIERIEADSNLKQRAISAFRGGFLEALKHNPVGAFVAGAIEGWANAEA
jgi:hypothetical protein